MNLSKFVVGELYIDTDKGMIWLNSDICILRISSLKFRSVEEKFSMIDINKNEVVMYPRNQENEKNSLINDVISDILISSMKSKSPELYFEKLQNLVKNIEV